MALASTLEQRKRFAEKLGNRLSGSAGAHLRMQRVCGECGELLPCACEQEEDASVSSQSRSRATKAETPVRYIPDTAARNKLRLLASAAGYTPPLKRDSIAEARRALALRKRRAGYS